MADFWSEENWFGKTQNPWQIGVTPGAYGTGTGGANMQSMLEAQSRGEGPSLGRGIMQQGLGQAVKNQNAQAASMMGTNPALAAKLSGQQAGEMTAQSNRDAAQVGLQEQMQAQAALQQWIQQERAAQMQLDMQRRMEQSRYQDRMLQQAQGDQGIFGDVMGLGGTALGFALGGPMGGAMGNQIGNAVGGMGSPAGNSMGTGGATYNDYMNPNWGF